MNLLRQVIFLVSLSSVLAGCDNNGPAQDAVAPEPATTVYLDGEIVTVNENQPTAEAVAVRDGRILAVGNREEVLAAAGSNVEEVDLKGNVLLPGLIDTHGHISFTSLIMEAVNVSSPPVGPAQTVADVVALLQAGLAESPEASFLYGYGYDDSLLAEQRHPTRRDLDQVSTEIPVVIRHVSGHLMACNSKCLEVAGVTAATEDPKGGVFRREAGGSEPDGVSEEAAMFLIMAIVPEPDDEQRLALLVAAQQYYASHGITTVQDGGHQYPHGPTEVLGLAGNFRENGLPAAPQTLRIHTDRKRRGHLSLFPELLAGTSHGSDAKTILSIPCHAAFVHGHNIRAKPLSCHRRFPWFHTREWLRGDRCSCSRSHQYAQS